jgi:hypothetical protein
MIPAFQPKQRSYPHAQLQPVSQAAGEPASDVTTPPPTSLPTYRELLPAGIAQSELHRMFDTLSQLTGLHDHAKRSQQRTRISHYAVGPYMDAIEALRATVVDLGALQASLTERLDTGWQMTSDDADRQHAIEDHFEVVLRQYEAVCQAASSDAIGWVLDRLGEARYAG